MMKTLLYLASGPYYENYETLPYEKVILVDSHSFRNGLQQPIGSKVKCMRMDALPAIQKLKDENVRIDCLVSLNEGLAEGGGHYPIFSDFLLGYLSPILNDDIIVITNLDYYDSFTLRHQIEKMDWGFKKSKVNPEDVDYIYPGIFSDSQRVQNRMYDAQFGHVFRLKRNKSEISLNLNQNLKIRIIHGSIWENPLADLIGIKLSTTIPLTGNGNTVQGFFLSHKNVWNIEDMSFENILKICEELKLKTISLAPWRKGDYSQMINDLRQFNGRCPEQIDFYHLNKNDFSDLRNLTYQ